MNAPRGKFGAWLELGRVSNLPTVWSNALAGYLLVGGTALSGLIAAVAALTLLYTGGMFLNDAWDEPWDRRHRPGRPLPSGRFSAKAAWAWALGMLAGGWSAAAWHGAAIPAAILVGLIALYTGVHKKTPFAVIPMALCRLLAYLVAAAMADPGLWRQILPEASTGAAYVVGVSLIARGEAFGRTPKRAQVLILFGICAVLALACADGMTVQSGAAVAPYLAWGGFLALSGAVLSPSLVGKLLAAIPLLDLGLIAALLGHLPVERIWVAFPVLFGMTLLAQKRVAGS